MITGKEVGDYRERRSGGLQGKEVGGITGNGCQGNYRQRRSGELQGKEVRVITGKGGQRELQ